MAATWAVARSTLRRRWGATVLLLVLVAVATAASVGAWAGARRTDTAFERFLDATADADVVLEGEPGDLNPVAVTGAPGVVSADFGAGYGMLAVGPDGHLDFESGIGFAVTLPDRMSRPLLLEGRFPDPTDPAEAVGSRPAVTSVGGLGHPVDVIVFDVNEAIAGAEGEEFTEGDFERLALSLGERRTITFTGIAHFREEVARSSDEEGEGQSIVAVTPAFAAGVGVPPTIELAVVDLADPASNLPGLEQAIRLVQPDGSFEVRSQRQQIELVDDANRPYLQSLRLFAGALAVAAALVLGQAVAREAELDATAVEQLTALGMPRRTATVAVGARSLLVVAGGITAGTVVAAMSTRWFPVGPLRGFDPDRGIRMDGVALSVGPALALAAGAVAAAMGARRSRVDRARTLRPSAAAAVTEALALPLAVSFGVRTALEARRDRAAGLASRLLGVILAGLAVTAALAFGAGLDRLVEEPARYGWSWDGLLDTFDTDMGDEEIGRLREDDRLAAVDLGSRATAVVGGRPVAAYAVEPLKGTPVLEVSAGRRAEGADEVVLGPRTRERLGVDLGDQVAVGAGGGETASYEVVGEAVFPAMAIDLTTALADGAAFTAEGLARVADVGPSFALLDLAPGASFADVEGAYDDIGQLFPPQQPGEVVSYDRVRGVPLLLAGVLAFLGAGVLGHGLLSSEQRDRRDLAVLKAIGFCRRQVGAIIRWQAVTMVAVALFVGVPLGVASGRILWRAFTDDLGAGGAPVMPWAGLTLLVVGALVLGVGLAAWPARRARHLHTSTVLRSE